MTSIRLHQLHSCPTGAGVAGTGPSASPSSHPPPAPHARSAPNGPSPRSSTPPTSSASSSVLTSPASPDLRSQQHGAPTGGQAAPASRSLRDRLRKAYKASGLTIGVVMTFIMWKYGVQSLMLQRYGLCDQLQQNNETLPNFCNDFLGEGVVQPSHQKRWISNIATLTRPKLSTFHTSLLNCSSLSIPGINSQSIGSRPKNDSSHGPLYLENKPDSCCLPDWQTKDSSFWAKISFTEYIAGAVLLILLIFLVSTVYASLGSQPLEPTMDNYDPNRPTEFAFTNRQLGQLVMFSPSCTDILPQSCSQSAPTNESQTSNGLPTSMQDSSHDDPIATNQLSQCLSVVMNPSVDNSLQVCLQNGLVLPTQLPIDLRSGISSTTNTASRDASHTDVVESSQQEDGPGDVFGRPTDSALQESVQVNPVDTDQYIDEFDVPPPPFSEGPPLWQDDRLDHEPSGPGEQAGPVLMESQSEERDDLDEDGMPPPPYMLEDTARCSWDTEPQPSPVRIENRGGSAASGTDAREALMLEIRSRRPRVVGPEGLSPPYALEDPAIDIHHQSFWTDAAQEERLRRAEVKKLAEARPEEEGEVANWFPFSPFYNVPSSDGVTSLEGKSPLVGVLQATWAMFTRYKERLRLNPKTEVAEDIWPIVEMTASSEMVFCRLYP